MGFKKSATYGHFNVLALYLMQSSQNLYYLQIWAETRVMQIILENMKDDGNVVDSSDVENGDDAIIL